MTARIAVARRKFVPGVYAPGFAGQTYDWRHARARDAEEPHPANTAEIWPAFETCELLPALEREYTTDAHLVTYTLADASTGDTLKRQPRVNKEGVAWVHAQGLEIWADVLMCDVDNPGHAPWNQELADAWIEAMQTVDVLKSCGTYPTAHGARLYQVLDEPVRCPDVERYLVAWLRQLDAAGVAVDWACRDWTRLFRLPNVRREAARPPKAKPATEVHA